MAEPFPAGHPARRSGWFAMVIGVGVLLIILGVWNVIDGLTALFAGGFVVADAERVLALEVAAWGWVLLALGVVEVIAGIALFIGARWARVVAVLVAGFNGIVQLAFLAAYPVGAVLIMVVAAVVIWTVILGVAFTFFKIQNALTKGGIRPTKEVEELGMDLPEMGALAYDNLVLNELDIVGSEGVTEVHSGGPSPDPTIGR